MLYENMIYPFKICLPNSFGKYKNYFKYSCITTSPATVVDTAGKLEVQSQCEWHNVSLDLSKATVTYLS